MRFRVSLAAIPVILAALGLWAVLGGWYVAVAPADMAGADNIGIVLSIFGICLFLADRLAFHWLRVDCWFVILKLWAWGLLFTAWGLVEWLKAFSGRYFWIFAVHWLAIALVLAAVLWRVTRRRRTRAV
ncbi:MAG: hypothetical protein JXO51_00635 [Candidatus Aminicenantes bacterium]|nr:hypothetical protein [Candidatus Aminicenantes bacterium]